MLYLSLLAGLVLLAVGGEALVRGAVGVAQRLGLSPLLIGLTLVGFGTSTPELVTSLQAAFTGAPGLAIGNVVGSNIANILLILGIAALIAPVAADPRALRRDGGVMAAATAAAILLAFLGEAGRLAGGLFLVALMTYLVVTYLTERKGATPSAELHVREGELVAAQPGPPAGALWLNLLIAVAGIAATIFGARLLVDGAVGLAQAAGVSETVIGLTIVAVGTSLPELVTAVVAALRKQSDVALGNVVGSNIFNILGILGATALIHPIPIDPALLAVDVWVLAAATVALLVFALTGRRLSRGEGGALLAGYIVYLSWLTLPALG